MKQLKNMDKLSRLVLYSTVAYIVVIAVTLKSFDLVSSLIYIGVALGVTQLAKSKYQRWDIEKIFMLAVVYSSIYHTVGLALAWYKIPLTFIILAALEQGVVAGIVYILMGGKKK